MEKNISTSSMQVNYEEWLELQHYKKRSIDTLKSLVLQLQNYLEKEGLEINGESIKSFAYWAANQGYSLVYQKHLQWGIRSYCLYLKLVQNLKIKVYLPKIKQSFNRRKALGKSDLEIIKNWLETTEKDKWLNLSLWCLFYGCGLRRREALNLELKDLEISEKLLHVRTLKGGEKRILPLSKKQIEALSNYIKFERPTPKDKYINKLIVGKKGGSAESMLGKVLIKWQDETNLGDRFCWHVLRHSIATQLVQKGMKLEEVSRFLGHQSIESTAIYLHQKPSKNGL